MTIVSLLVGFVTHHGIVTSADLPTGYKLIIPQSTPQSRGLEESFFLGLSLDINLLTSYTALGGVQ